MWGRDEEERMASGYDGHHAKRQRTEDGSRGREGGGDPHKPNPSPVVHVRGLSDAATEADLVQAVQHFGSVGVARNCVKYSRGGDDPRAPNHFIVHRLKSTVSYNSGCNAHHLWAIWSACVGSRTFRCSIGSDGDWQRSHQYTITVSVVIPMAIAIFLIIILCILFVMVRRCRRNQMLLQARRDGIPSVSGDVSSRHRRRRRRNGRHRDAPPSYEEVLQNTPCFNSIASPESEFDTLTFNFPSPDGFPILHPPPYEEVVGTAGATNHQDSNEMTRPQPGNVSPASSSDISHTDMDSPYRHRNLTPLSSDSTDSCQIRPSVHSYSMSYSSDSEMDLPRMNREVRDESTAIDSQPRSQQIQNINKITDQDTNCCQVSEQEVAPKTVRNKSQNASQESEQNLSAETASSLENNEGGQVRHLCSSNNEQRAGPSVESSRTSASTQTKKKRNKRKKSRSKRQESVNSEQEVNVGTITAADSQQEIDHSHHSASAAEADCGNLSFDFSHFNVNTNNETGHDNLAFCGDSIEENIKNTDETVVNVTEDLPCLTDHGHLVSQADNPSISGDTFELENRMGTEECVVSEHLPNNDNVSVPSSSVHHIDSLPVQLPDGQIGPSFLALLHEGNDEDIFV
ncbi:hypothetical protein KUTeg_005737 [Tegillarca granosa]|uniref:RRM domain-containing protein n=1 Tax=Tegillarca granosa TaxID=220873 RepID=A0ABQ9FLB8_TEGGR|nr:hypothetical protein KUTeg_005737 [Tegillarca granosa]